MEFRLELEYFVQNILQKLVLNLFWKSSIWIQYKSLRVLVRAYIQVHILFLFDPIKHNENNNS